MVLDPEAGDRIREIAARQPVWVSPSVSNNSAVERIRSEDADISKSITLWSIARQTQSEEDWRSVVYDVDLHHGEYSHDPPVSVIEVFGPAPSRDAEAAFSSFGFTSISRSPFGFTARKPSA